jgi:hypothetical protein
MHLDIAPIIDSLMNVIINPGISAIISPGMQFHKNKA